MTAIRLRPMGSTFAMILFSVAATTVNPFFVGSSAIRLQSYNYRHWSHIRFTAHGLWVIGCSCPRTRCESSSMPLLLTTHHMHFPRTLFSPSFSIWKTFGQCSTPIHVGYNKDFERGLWVIPIVLSAWWCPPCVGRLPYCAVFPSIRHTSDEDGLSRYRQTGSTEG